MSDNPIKPTDKNFFYRMRGWFGRSGAPKVSKGAQSGSPNGTGLLAAPVTFDSAMQISAVWAAVRILAETVASLPFEIYKKGNGGGQEPDTGNNLRDLLRKKPNRYQTPVEFWESVMLNLVISGNSYVIVERLGSRIVSLLPVSSAQIETSLLDDGSVIYTLTTDSSVKVYSGESMWHVKLFGNGIVGMSPLEYAAKSIGIAIASDDRVSKIWSNGAKPSGVLSIDKVLKPEQRSQIKANFAGLDYGNDDRLYVLEAGMQYTQVSMSPKDIELLDSRRFQIEDIGRFFGVPSILLNQTFGQSSLGSNVSEILEAFYKLNLRPYLEKLESSVVCWLLKSNPDEHECEFDFNALIRGDEKTRIDTYARAIQTAQMTPNEARNREGRANMEGGDKLLIQGATVPVTEQEAVNDIRA